jgi:short-subunit dehydrogenase
MAVTEAPAPVQSSSSAVAAKVAGRAIVVGASSGMGAALVRQLAAGGHRVAAVARRLDRLEALAAEAGDGVIVRAHDVTDTGAVPDLFEQLVRELGGLDLIVYAAGIMPAVGPAEYDTSKDLAMLEINVGGCIAWCNEAARLFATQRSGTICGISSIAGVRGRKGQPVYGTTKAAMDHYLEALRNRLAEGGAHVLTIRPGFVETEMTADLGLSGAISAEAAASSILKAVRRRANVRYVPLKWWAIAQVVKAIPSFIFKKLSI